MHERVDLATSLAALNETLVEDAPADERAGGDVMKRAQRLKMVQNVVEDLERRRAEQLALTEKRVNESELRLTELETYQANYSREFASRAREGIGAAGLRDFPNLRDDLGVHHPPHDGAVVHALPAPPAHPLSQRPRPHHHHRGHAGQRWTVSDRAILLPQRPRDRGAGRRHHRLRPPRHGRGPERCWKPPTSTCRSTCIPASSDTCRPTSRACGRAGCSSTSSPLMARPSRRDIRCDARRNRAPSATVSGWPQR